MDGFEHVHSLTLNDLGWFKQVKDGIDSRSRENDVLLSANEKLVKGEMSKKANCKGWWCTQT